MVADPRGHLRVVDDGAPEPPPRTSDTALEDFVVGACIGESESVKREVRELLRVDMFESGRARRTFEAVVAVAADGRSVDTVSVASELRARGRLAEVTPAYVTAVTLERPVLDAGAVVEKARALVSLHVRRQAAAVARSVIVDAEHGDRKTGAILARARGRLDDLERELAGGHAPTRIDTAVDRALGEVLDASQTKPGAGVVRTGYASLDRETLGLPRDFCALGADPGSGKTSLACGMAVHVARQGLAVVIMSLETPHEELTKRMIATEARVDAGRAVAGLLTPSELSRFCTASRALRDLYIFVEDRPSSAVDVRAKCRSVTVSLAREGIKLGLVVIDYLQLLRSLRERERRNLEIAETARALKDLAIEYRVPVLALSQLNGAGQFAESAELRRAARWAVTLSKPKNGQVVVKIPKINLGAADRSVTLAFDGPSLRFSDLPEDMPLLATPGPTYTCGACGGRTSAGQSCPCGKTTSPAAHAANCRCDDCRGAAIAGAQVDDEPPSLFPPGFEP